MTLKTCVICGEICDGPRCPDHVARPRKKVSATRRGYDTRWQRLSARARHLQPWCSRCGTHDDLTTDHLHWPARTLADVDVLCRSCNAAKGKAVGRDQWLEKSRQRRAESPREATLNEHSLDPRGKAEKLTLSENDSQFGGVGRG